MFWASVLVILLMVAPASTWGFYLLPVSSLLNVRLTSRPLSTALASQQPPPSRRDSGEYIPQSYGLEEEAEDPYLVSLKRGEPPRREAGVGSTSASPAGPSHAGQTRTPEEIKALNEAAKARMEAYARGEKPPGFGASPPVPSGFTPSTPDTPEGFNPNKFMDFYREHEAKLAAENAAKAAETPAQVAVPRPQGAPIMPGVPEPYQPPPQYQQQPSPAQLQAQEEQAKGSPQSYESHGGSRFKGFFDAAAAAGSTNPAKERLKQYLLSRYAPDDMSEQAVNYRRLIQFADTGGGYTGSSTEDSDEAYLAQLKADAREKIRNNPWQTVRREELAPSEKGVPLPPLAPTPEPTGTQAAARQDAGLGRPPPPPSMSGSSPLPPPPGWIPPSSPPPSTTPSSAYASPPSYTPSPAQIPSPPPPFPPSPGPSPPALAQMGIESSLTQLGAYLTAHKATGERLQGQDLDRLESLLTSVGAMLEGEGRRLGSRPAYPEEEGPGVPVQGFLVEREEREVLLATAASLQALAGLGADEEGALAAGREVPRLQVLLRRALTVVDGPSGGEAPEYSQKAGASPPSEASSAPAAMQGPGATPRPQSVRDVSPPVPASPSLTPPPSPPSPPSSAPPPSLDTVELSSEDRAKLQGTMALVLKHSGAFGKMSGPLRGEELGLLKSVLNDTMAVLRKETETAYDCSVEKYLEDHPHAMEELAEAQAAAASTGSQFTVLNVPAPAAGKPKSYKELLSEARQKKKP